MNPRIIKLREKLAKKNIQGMIISNPKNIFYLTNIFAEGILLITEKENIYITDSRYIEVARTSTTIEDELIIYETRDVSIYDYENFFEFCINVGFEEKHTTFYEYKMYMHKYKVNNFVETEGIIEKFRMIKNADEIQRIQRACQLTDKCFEHIVKFMKKGISEKQVSYEIERYLEIECNVKKSFDIIVASGKNSAMPHAIPSSKKLESGDPVVIDFGCVYEGYSSDMTRTVFIDYIPENIKKIYDLVLKNQLYTIRDLREGITSKTIDKMVDSDFAINGHQLIHSLGHSVGLDIHEKPSINYNDETMLKENMVLTIEPGIYIPESFGVRIEDTVLITKSGAISLTESEKKYIVI